MLFRSHLGSSVVVVSSGGGWINREEFFPYGECAFGSFARKRYRYGGKQRDDESGMGYHGARYVSPAILRWISCDPLDISDGLNLYNFLQSNPLFFSDPSGTEAKSQESSKESSNTICDKAHIYKDKDGVTTIEIHLTPQRHSIADEHAAEERTPPSGPAAQDKPHDMPNTKPDSPSIHSEGEYTPTQFVKDIFNPDTLRKGLEASRLSTEERQAMLTHAYMRSGYSEERSRELTEQALKGFRNLGYMIGGAAATKIVAGGASATTVLGSLIRRSNRAGNFNSEQLAEGLRKLGVPTYTEKYVRDAAGKLLLPPRRWDIVPIDTKGAQPIEITLGRLTSRFKLRQMVRDILHKLAPGGRTIADGDKLIPVGSDPIHIQGWSYWVNAVDKLLN